MSENEEKSKVVRIVNLDQNTNEKSLRELIITIVGLVGQIEKLFIRRYYRTGVYYAYIIFQLSEDAAKTTDMLNGYISNQLKLEAELIHPHLKYKKYNRYGEMEKLLPYLLGKRKLELSPPDAKIRIAEKRQRTHYNSNFHLRHHYRR